MARAERSSGKRIAVSPRDFQRSPVYGAESALRTLIDRMLETGLPSVQLAGTDVVLTADRRFASIESVQTYTDAVLALPWVQARWPRAAQPVHVRARRSAAAAHYEATSQTIAVPDQRIGWAMRELVVLHELAHHLTWDDAAPPHGPAFASAMLELVTVLLGEQDGFALRVLDHEHGVRLG